MLPAVPSCVLTIVRAFLLLFWYQRSDFFRGVLSSLCSLKCLPQGSHFPSAPRRHFLVTVLYLPFAFTTFAGVLIPYQWSSWLSPPTVLFCGKLGWGGHGPGSRVAGNSVGPSGIWLKPLRFYFPLSSGTELWDFSLWKRSLPHHWSREGQPASRVSSFSPGPSPRCGHTWPGVCCRASPGAHRAFRLRVSRNASQFWQMCFVCCFSPQPLISLSLLFLRHSHMHPCFHLLLT